MARFAYWTVIEADSEPEARAFCERALQPEAAPCVQLGGGVQVAKPRSRGGYITGPVAARMAKAAYEGDGGEVEEISARLQRIAED